MSSWGQIGTACCCGGTLQRPSALSLVSMPMEEVEAAVSGHIHVGLRVTEDRVLIRADEDAHAPRETSSGLLLAPTMASAVEGTDAAESWCTGRIVQVGPLVGWRDVRKQVVRLLLELEQEFFCCLEGCHTKKDVYAVNVDQVAAIRQRIEQVKPDCAEPLRVGQRVAFSWQVGHQITVDGVPYVVLRAGDVLAVIED